MVEEIKKMNLVEQRSFVHNIQGKYQVLQQQSVGLRNQSINLNGQLSEITSQIDSNKKKRQALKLEKAQLIISEKQRKKEKSQNKTAINALKSSQKQYKKDLKKFDQKYKKEIKSLEKKQNNSLNGPESFSELEKNRLMILTQERIKISNNINKEKQGIEQLKNKIEDLDYQKKNNLSRIKDINNSKKNFKNENIKKEDIKKSLNAKANNNNKSQKINKKDIAGISTVLGQEVAKLQAKEQEVILEQAKKVAKEEKEAKELEKRRQVNIKRKKEEEKLEQLKIDKAKKLGISHLTNSQAQSQKKDNQRMLEQIKIAKIQEDNNRKRQEDLRIKANNVKAIQATLQGSDPKYKDPDLAALDKRLQALSPDATPNVRNNSGGKGRY